MFSVPGTVHRNDISIYEHHKKKNLNSNTIPGFRILRAQKFAKKVMILRNKNEINLFEYFSTKKKRKTKNF